jgi:hypothetical protein
MPTNGVDAVPNAANETVSPGKIEISYGVKSNVASEVADTTVENTCDPPDTVTYDVGAGTLVDVHDWPFVIVTPLSAVVPFVARNVVGPDV